MNVISYRYLKQWCRHLHDCHFYRVEWLSDVYFNSVEQLIANRVPFLVKTGRQSLEHSMYRHQYDDRHFTFIILRPRMCRHRYLRHPELHGCKASFKRPTICSKHLRYRNAYRNDFSNSPNGDIAFLDDKALFLLPLYLKLLKLPLLVFLI